VTGILQHLSDETLMNVLDGAEGGPAAQHVAACPACAARLADAQEGLALARAADVPEPAGVYWQSFPRQVARRLDAPPAARRSWPLWAVRGVIAGVAVGAAAVTFLARPVSRPPPPTPAPALPAWSALPPAEKDAALPVLQALGPELDPALECGGVAECLAELTEEESQDLVQALRASVKESRL
jgi:hypothetical protein